jgi:peptidoglycan/LPS O-acetylase OafA/YrhL
MSAQTSQSNRYLWLDLFRGAAAMGVLSFHVVVNHRPQLNGLYVLVDFFFVLSGFVLWPAMPHHGEKFARSSGRFIVKRLLRLWPMLVAVLVISNVIYLITHYATHEWRWDPNRHWGYLMAALFFLQTVVSTSMFMVVPLWSLSAELFANLFYLPLTIFKSNKGIWYGVAAGYLAFNIGLTMDQGWIGFIGPIRGFEAIGRALIGFGLGLLIRKNMERLAKFRNLTLLLIAGYGAWWSLFSDQTYGYNNGYFVGIIFALFILQVSKYSLSSESRLGKFAAFLGSYSYGIYGFHQVMIDMTSHMIKTPSSFKVDHVWLIYFIEKCSLVSFFAILATFIVHRVFEGPIQRWGGRKIKAPVT